LRIPIPCRNYLWVHISLESTPLREKENSESLPDPKTVAELRWYNINPTVQPYPLDYHPLTYGTVYVSTGLYCYFNYTFLHLIPRPRHHLAKTFSLTQCQSFIFAILDTGCKLVNLQQFLLFVVGCKLVYMNVCARTVRSKRKSCVSCVNYKVLEVAAPAKGRTSSPSTSPKT